MNFFDPHSADLLPGLFDLVIMGVYLVLMFIVAHYTRQRNIENNPAYRFYVWGLLAKVVGAFAICMVYTLYYKEGGDTNQFFRNSQSLVRLLFNDPGAYFRVLFGERGPEVYSYFDSDTGWPWMYRDPESFVVVRITSIFTLFGFGNFFTTTLLVAWLSYKGIWRLYLLFSELYPRLYRKFALAILFFPSLVFWGSGILKDTYTILALGYFIYAFYYGLIVREKVFLNLLAVLLSAMLLLLIKPYILIALLPGTIIWLTYNRLKKFGNPLLRWLAAPFIIVVFIVAGLSFIHYFSEELGPYGTIEGILLKAQITQQDLIRAEAYSEHYFDIGTLDGTLGNFVSKAPAALLAGLFRPFLWEAGTFFMMVSALEVSVLMIVVLITLFRVGPLRSLKIIANEPLLIFSFLFVLIFAFAVGISTANFGALVRLRIPYLPFFAAGLVIMDHLSKKWKAHKQVTGTPEGNPFLRT